MPVLLGTDEDTLAETRAFNTQLAELLATLPALETTPVAVSRKLGEEGDGVFPAPVVLPEGRDRTIAGRSGDIPLRVFVPPRVDGVYFHIHGGGWVLGSARHQDPWLWEIAQYANVAVVSVDYRLAPEHPYPAGPDDCEDAALWLLDVAQQEFGSRRLLIGGESAGGHLAAVTLLRLRDRHGVRGAFAAANLVFGVYDLSGTPSVWRWGDRNLVLSRPVMEWFDAQFVPALDIAQLRDPDISPLWADLHDLPPALFTVGTADPLLDDTLFMEARWRSAGNATTLEVYADAPHGFTEFLMSVGRLSLQSQLAFLRKHSAG